MAQAALLAGDHTGEKPMRSCLLYLIGIPIPVIILIWILTGHM